DTVIAVLAEIDPFTGDVDKRELAITKSRDGTTGAVAPFTLQFTVLGTTASGQEFGTCYVVPDLKSETGFGVKKGRATRSALALRDAITEAIDSCGTNLTLRST